MSVREPYLPEFGGSSGGGSIAPPAVQERAGVQVGPAVKRKAPATSVFNNRRGLLLNTEQLAGPAAPHYLLRAPYVYARQSLL